VAEALRGTHWFDVREWATSGPGANARTAAPRTALTTLRRVPAIVIPYRGDAKRRLSSSLRPLSRSRCSATSSRRCAGRSCPRGDGRCVGRAGRRGGRAIRRGARRRGRSRAFARREPRSRRERRLPATTPAALRRLAEAGSRSWRPPTARRTRSRFPTGPVSRAVRPGSADRFRAHAAFATVSIPELEIDVDSDADLERLDARIGPRTRALLAVPA
jgi:hypothetical protein